MWIGTFHFSDTKYFLNICLLLLPSLSSSLLQKATKVIFLLYNSDHDIVVFSKVVSSHFYTEI